MWQLTVCHRCTTWRTVTLTFVMISLIWFQYAFCFHIKSLLFCFILFVFIFIYARLSWHNTRKSNRSALFMRISWLICLFVCLCECYLTFTHAQPYTHVYMMPMFGGWRALVLGRSTSPLMAAVILWSKLSGAHLIRFIAIVCARPCPPVRGDLSCLSHTLLHGVGMSTESGVWMSHLCMAGFCRSVVYKHAFLFNFYFFDRDTYKYTYIYVCMYVCKMWRNASAMILFRNSNYLFIEISIIFIICQCISLYYALGCLINLRPIIQ